MRGIQAFFQGFGAAFAPGVGRYVWVPALLSLAIVGTMLAVAFSFIDDLALAMVEALPQFLSWLDWILAPLLYLIGLLAGAWLFGFLAITVASPFLSDLSARIETVRWGDNPQVALSIGDGLKVSIKREWRKLRYQLPRLIGLLILGFVPVVNVAAPVLWFIFGGWMMAVQFCDYPAENRNQSFEDTLELLRRNRMSAIGFGGLTTLALAIPLVNFLVIPIAVAGGTLLWRRLAQADARRVNSDVSR